jgi:sugar porter (SP) family MFS transporter
MCGALLCFKVGDVLGRLRTIAVGCVFTVIGSVILCASFSLGQLIVGRLVLGLGFGAISATVPVWQSESSPAEHRGALVVLEGAFASVGLALSQWIDLGLFFTRGSVSWRFPLAIPILLALFILAVLPFQPDSPRWLVKKGRIAEAIALMAILEDLPEDSAVVAEEIHKMQVSLSEIGKGSFRGLFQNKEERLLNRTLLAMFSTFSQQMNGIGIIGFYTAVIYSNLLGLSPLVARILSGCTYMFQLGCTLVAFFTIDRIGRRPLMMFGTIGMGIVYIILSGTVAYASESKACASIAAACVFLMTMFFAIGALGINYLYGTEVAPLAYRVPIYALTTATLWSCNFLVVEVTPIGFTNLGYKFLVVFAVINLCLLTPGMCPLFASAYYIGALLTRWPGSVVYFFFPETRGWSLEDMDAIFMMAKHSLDVPKAGRRMPQVSILAVSDHVQVPVQGGDKATEGREEGEGEGEGKGIVQHMENA